MDNVTTKPLKTRHFLFRRKTPEASRMRHLESIEKRGFRAITRAIIARKTGFSESFRESRNRNANCESRRLSRRNGAIHTQESHVFRYRADNLAVLEMGQKWDITQPAAHRLAGKSYAARVSALARDREMGHRAL